MKLSRILLWIAALGFGGFGLAFCLFPRELGAYVGIILQNDSARTDFVATYGGLELGVAGFLVYCTRRDERVALGLVAGGFALAGFGLARLAGVLLAEYTMPILLVFLGIEIVGALLCFWGARNAQDVRGPHAPSPRTLDF